MEYFHFELTLGEGSEGVFPVGVLRSPAGEARGTLRLTWDTDQLWTRLASVEHALRRSGGTRGVELGEAGVPESVAEFGGALFRSVMREAVRICYCTFRALAAQAKAAGIVLDHDVMAMPWGQMAFAVTDPDGFKLTIANER